MSGLVGPPPRSAVRRAARGPVRSSVRHTVSVGLLVSAGLVVAIIVHAPDRSLAERLYAASIAALVLVVLVRAVAALSAGSRERTFDQLVRPPDPEEEGQLRGVAALEQSVRFSTTSAGDFHSRLRPVLVDIARHRLAERGIQLDGPAQQERAEAVLGTVTYDVVRPGVEAPTERFAPGFPRAIVETVTARLRELG